MGKKTRNIKITDLKADKPWLKKKTASKYRSNVREIRNSFLVICEGQTEELYFKSFPVTNVRIEALGVGCSKTQLVSCAEQLEEEGSYDEVWCVFDMDRKPGEGNQEASFDNAINSAKALGFKCAYSNDAFELWFVLHYDFVYQQNGRESYFRHLSDKWNLSYKRNGKKWEFAARIYERLQSDPNASQKRAIEAAKRMYRERKYLPPHAQEPVTTVYQLVECLNEYLKK